jgi:nickel transport protein
MRRCLLVLALPALAAAHDLVVHLEQAGPAVVLRASYDGADPAGRADVEVFQPGEARNLYQSGSTDAAGAFAFVPTQPGDWLAVVDDGYGHRTETHVEWRGGEVSPAPAAAPSRADWRSALTGVSLLIGLTGIWLWRQSRTAGGLPR